MSILNSLGAQLLGGLPSQQGVGDDDLTVEELSRRRLAASPLMIRGRTVNVRPLPAGFGAGVPPPKGQVAGPPMPLAGSFATPAISDPAALALLAQAQGGVAADVARAGTTPAGVPGLREGSPEWQQALSALTNNRTPLGIVKAPFVGPPSWTRAMIPARNFLYPDEQKAQEQEEATDPWGPRLNAMARLSAQAGKIAPEGAMGEAERFLRSKGIADEKVLAQAAAQEAREKGVSQVGMPFEARSLTGTPATSANATPLGGQQTSAPGSFLSDLDRYGQGLAQRFEATRQLDPSELNQLPGGITITRGLQQHYVPMEAYPGQSRDLNVENEKRQAGRQALVGQMQALPSFVSLEGHHITAQSALAQKSADLRGDITKLIVAQLAQNPDMKPQEAFGTAEVASALQQIMQIDRMTNMFGGKPPPSMKEVRDELVARASAIWKVKQEGPRQEELQTALAMAVPGTKYAQGATPLDSPISIGALSPSGLSQAITEHPRLMEGESLKQFIRRLENYPGAGGSQAIINALQNEMIRYMEQADLDKVGNFNLKDTGWVGKDNLLVHPLATSVPGSILDAFRLGPRSDFIPTTSPQTKSIYGARAKAIAPLLEELYKAHPQTRR